MRQTVHCIAALLAALSAVWFVYCRSVATTSLAPDRPLGDAFTTALTPSARPNDFVGRGWSAYKLQWLAVAVFIAIMIVYGITGTRS